MKSKRKLIAEVLLRTFGVMAGMLLGLTALALADQNGIVIWRAAISIPLFFLVPPMAVELWFWLVNRTKRNRSKWFELLLVVGAAASCLFLAGAFVSIIPVIIGVPVVGFLLFVWMKTHTNLF